MLLSVNPRSFCVLLTCAVDSVGSGDSVAGIPHLHSLFPSNQWLTGASRAGCDEGSVFCWGGACVAE